MKQTAFWREKNGECAACLKYSARIFADQIYKMQRLEVSVAVRHIYMALGVKGLRIKINLNYTQIFRFYRKEKRFWLNYNRKLQCIRKWSLLNANNMQKNRYFSMLATWQPAHINDWVANGTDSYQSQSSCEDPKSIVVKPLSCLQRLYQKVRSSLFWDVTQRWLVVTYRLFETTSRSHLQGSSFFTLQGGTDRLFRNVGQYRLMLGDIP
jgi:hypothetical protein